MRRFALCRILLLAILLAVSQVALAVHVTAHSGSDLGQCALCIGHAKCGSATLQSGDFDEPRILGPIDLNTLEPCVVPRVVLHPYQTRAPPFVS